MQFVSGTMCHHARPVKGQSQRPMSAFPALVSAMVPTCRSALALFRLLSLHRLLTLEKHDQAQVTFVIRLKNDAITKSYINRTKLLVFFFSIGCILINELNKFFLNFNYNLKKNPIFCNFDCL